MAASMLAKLPVLSFQAAPDKVGIWASNMTGVLLERRRET
jgi:hypothetical protein